MRYFIKLLLFSFPLVFTAILYWPTLEQEIMSPATSVAAEIPSETEPQAVRRAKPASGIYRWKDENGKTVFSDSPGHENALGHTPDEIGYTRVSDDIKQRAAKENIRQGRVQSSGAAATQASRYPSKRAQTGYKFSMTSAGQKHGYVLLSGRIARGATCKQLKVVAEAKSDMGGFVRGSDTTSYNGFGSTLFEIKLKSKWDGRSRRPQWEISKVSARCVL
jgi:hypothetical protein